MFASLPDNDSHDDDISIWWQTENFICERVCVCDESDVLDVHLCQLKLIGANVTLVH